MKHNFFAGPAILPKEVLAKAGESAHLVPEEGLSILEMSHRGAFITNVMEQAVSTCKELLNVPDDYAILFLTGGASSQFYMTPMNILAADQTAAYIDTGTWSTKAIKEAKLYGNVDIVASSADKNFNYIPTLGDIDGSKYRYLHYTANNTIFGTQFSDVPQTDARLVCDMSSEMFSRSVDVSKYDIIYAGAQKNMGPAGTTLVIIYVSMLTMQWVKSMGGVDAMAKINADKGKILYDELDRNALFKANVPEGSRSLMNVTFLLNDDSKNAAFLEMCAAANIVGIKGHRSVGGFRASIYNAMPKSSIEVLIDVMKEFERTHG